MARSNQHTRPIHVYNIFNTPWKPVQVRVYMTVRNRVTNQPVRITSRSQTRDPTSFGNALSTLQPGLLLLLLLLLLLECPCAYLHLWSPYLRAGSKWIGRRLCLGFSDQSIELMHMFSKKTYVNKPSQTPHIHKYIHTGMSAHQTTSHKKTST